MMIMLFAVAAAIYEVAAHRLDPKETSLRTRATFVAFVGVSLLIGQWVANWTAQIVTICHLRGWRAYASGLRIVAVHRTRLFLSDGTIVGQDEHDFWTGVLMLSLVLTAFLVVVCMFKYLKAYSPALAADLVRHVRRKPRRKA